MNCVIDTTPPTSSVTVILLIAIALVMVVSCCFWYNSTFGEARHQLHYENQELLDQFYKEGGGGLPVGMGANNDSLSKKPKFEPMNKVPFRRPDSQNPSMQAIPIL